MKVLVCGGRHFKNRALLDLTLDRVHARRPFDCVIHGGAEGADLMAGQWAELNGLDIEVFEAHWNTYHGNRAGNVRNARMLREGKPGMVIAFEGGSGTQDMICKSLYIHSLVLEAFVGPRPTGMDCCHNNDDKADNRLCNLRWDSRANNLADRKRNGRLSSSYKVRVCRPATYKVTYGRSGPMYKGRVGEVGTKGASPPGGSR